MGINTRNNDVTYSFIQSVWLQKHIKCISHTAKLIVSKLFLKNYNLFCKPNRLFNKLTGPNAHTQTPIYPQWNDKGHSHWWNH